MGHPNENFLKRFLDVRPLIEQRHLPGKKEIRENYKNQKQIPKENILQEQYKHNILSLTERMINKKHNIVEQKTDPNDWMPQVTPYGLFYFNKSTKQWKNVYGVIMDNIDDLVKLSYVYESSGNENSRIRKTSTNYSMISSSKTGGFLAYLTTDGTVQCIGDFSPGSENVNDGYLDYGQTTVPSGLGKCKQVDCGYQHTLALKTDGTMVAWGNDANKQAKDGTEAIQSQITAAGRTVVKIACGGNHNLALLDDGSVVAWGENEGSQLSDPNTYWTSNGYLTQGNSLYINYPELSGYIDTDGGGILRRHYRCSEVNNTRNVNNCESPYTAGHTAYDGSVIDAPNSVVGTGWETVTNAPYDYQFARNTTGIVGHVNYSGGGWTRNPDSASALGTSNKKYVDIAAGRTHNILLTTNGTIEVWGLNFYYAVTGSGLHSADGRSPCDYINHTGNNCFLRSGSGSGSIPWGDNTAPTVKILKTTPNSVSSITASYYNCAVIKNDGSLFVWDRNENGESLPTTGLPTGPFLQIAGGKEHFIALKSDGTVVCWGDNYYQQCSIPANLTNCISVGAGRTYSYAIKADGTTIFWGDLNPLGGTPVINF